MATTFTNQAALSYNGGSALSNVAVGVIESSLSITKEALAQDYRPGDRITYVVSIVNNGGTSVGNLTVTDDLGAYTFDNNVLRQLSYVDGSARYYRNGVLQAAPTVSTANGLVFGNISVPTGGSAMLIYEATANEFASPEPRAELVNTVTADNCAISAVTASESLPIAQSPEISLIKSITPVPVAENGEVSYTIRMENNGNTAVTAADNAVISDTLSPILRNIRVTLDAEPLARGSDYTYNQNTGRFATTGGTVEIPAATFARNPVTGAYTGTPGTATLVITGTITRSQPIIPQ